MWLIRLTSTSLDQEEEGLISKRFSLDEFEAMIVSVYGFAKIKGVEI